MIVFCKMHYCPFCMEEGFCGRPITAIDQNGMCSVLWYNGQQRSNVKPPFSQDIYKKDPLTIIEIEAKPFKEKAEKDEKTEGKEEMALDPSEGFLNDASAHE